MTGQRSKGGFTLVEVLLFLAVSSVIIIALMAGLTQTVARQRYNDTVQDFVEFLRRQYSEVITTTNGRGQEDNTCARYHTARNSFLASKDSMFSLPPLDDDLRTVANNLLATAPDPDTVDGGGRGRSECNIYGKVLVFGQGPFTEPTIPGNGNTVRVYDIIGADLGTLPSSMRLSDYSSFFAIVPAMLDGACGIGSEDQVLNYNLQWGGRATTISSDSAGNANTLQAVMVIMRSPNNGTVRTIIAEEDAARRFINTFGNAISGDAVAGNCAYSGSGYSLWQLIGDKRGSFSNGLDICVDSEDVYSVGWQRRMVTIRPDGRNGTAVELLPLNTETEDGRTNLCQ